MTRVPTAPTEPSKITPGRVATLLAALAGLATALAPVVANMDWQSTAGVIAGGLGVVTAICAWLQGWRSYEHDERKAAAAAVTSSTLPPV